MATNAFLVYLEPIGNVSGGGCKCRSHHGQGANGAERATSRQEKDGGKEKKGMERKCRKGTGEKISTKWLRPWIPSILRYCIPVVFTITHDGAQSIWVTCWLYHAIYPTQCRTVSSPCRPWRCQIIYISESLTSCVSATVTVLGSNEGRSDCGRHYNDNGRPDPTSTECRPITDTNLCGRTRRRVSPTTSINSDDDKSFRCCLNWISQSPTCLLGPSQWRI